MIVIFMITFIILTIILLLADIIGFIIITISTLTKSSCYIIKTGTRTILKMLKMCFRKDRSFKKMFSLFMKGREE